MREADTRRTLIKTGAAVGLGLFLNSMAGPVLALEDQTEEHKIQFTDLVRSSLADLYVSARNPGALATKPAVLAYKIETLEWLLDRDLPIDLTDNSDLYLPNEKIIGYGLVLRAVNAHMGLDSLSSITISQTNKTEFIKGSNRITLKSERTPQALAHELGHLVFNLGDNRARYLAIRGFPGPAPKDTQAVMNEHSNDDESEDFTTIFGPYLWEPSAVQARIYQLRQKDPASEELFAAKTQNIVDLFHGQKYADGAIPLELAA